MFTAKKVGDTVDIVAKRVGKREDDNQFSPNSYMLRIVWELLV